MAEAGLFPGIVLLFTYWFPDHHRARIVSSFTLALPISVALGAPISTAILGMDGFLGVAGWKWIYIMEAIPTVLIGFFVLFLLTDKPAKARWLTAEEKNWLITTLEQERRAVESAGKFSLWQALVNPKILLLSLNYLGIVTASLGVLLFVPQIIKSLGATNMGTGYATMLAYICGAISMMVWGWVSDRMGERRWNLFWACTLATVGLVIAGMTMGTWWSLAGMCIATAGFYGTKGPFWSMPSMLLTGTAAAAGIAWINSIGNVGGAVGPAIVGWIKDFTGSYSGGLYGLAIVHRRLGADRRVRTAHPAAGPAAPRGRAGRIVAGRLRLARRSRAPAACRPRSACLGSVSLSRFASRFWLFRAYGARGAHGSWGLAPTPHPAGTGADRATSDTGARPFGDGLVGAKGWIVCMVRERVGVITVDFKS